MAHRDHLYDRPTGRDDGLEPRLELDAIPPLPAEDAPDVLGLAHTFPRPGWVVLDAIRERGLTGEVVCRTTPKMTVWADRGRVYHAEREDDPPLGDRLVAGGALTVAALADGSVRVGAGEHLAKLFERVPSVDRDAVLVAHETLTDERLGWLAAQRVHGAVVTPYRHHASGVHHWQAAGSTVPGPAAFPAPTAPSPASAVPPAPTKPLLPPLPPLPPSVSAPNTTPPPPPPPRSIPALPSPSTSFAPPAPHLVGALASMPAPSAPGAPPEPVGVIRWDDPGWLDEPVPGERSSGLIAPLPTPGRDQSGERTPGEGLTIRPLMVLSRPAVPAAPVVMAPPPAPLAPLPVHPSEIEVPAASRMAPPPATLLESDWVDRLGVAGLPEPGDDPLVAPVQLPPVHVDRTLDRFEVIWPSGEVDEQFGGQTLEPFPNPDDDRAGPTARMTRDGARGNDGADAAQGDVVDVRSLLGGKGLDDLLAADTAATPTGDTVTGAVASDDVLDAVRRAVAEIEIGSLAQPRVERRVGPRSGAVITTGLSGSTSMVVPNRSAGETTGEIPITSTGRMTHPHPSRGSVFDEMPLPAVVIDVTEPITAYEEPEADRASALKRLIGSLRKPR
jgi:hypothetical protein